jgi:hypothetical protein
MSTVLKVDKQSIEDIWRNFKKNIAPKFKPSDKKDMLAYSTTADEIINILKSQPNNFKNKDPEYYTRFIELCNQKGYLNNWTVALKVAGSCQTDKDLSYFGLNTDIGIGSIKLAKRSGPRRKDDVDMFINQKKFKASSKSANILSSNADVAIFLSKQEIELAKGNFYDFKAKELLKKDDSLAYDSAYEKAKKDYKTIPERYYRGQFKSDQGLLIIYLFDSKYCFNELGTENIEDSDVKKYIEAIFKEYRDENIIDTSIPLVGYALEFPPIEEEIGGTYMQGDYNLETDEIDKDDELEGEDERESVQDLNEV